MTRKRKVGHLDVEDCPGLRWVSMRKVLAGLTRSRWSHLVAEWFEKWFRHVVERKSVIGDRNRDVLEGKPYVLVPYWFVTLWKT